MTPQTFTLSSLEKKGEAAQAVFQADEGLVCTIDEPKRSLSQNALLHKWFGEVATHYGDRTAKQVKGECHHKYGLEYRLKDPQFEWVWQRTGAHLSYEQQCGLLASETLGVSSKMKSPELKAYMDEMQRDYLNEGIRLTIPEERSR